MTQDLEALRARRHELQQLDDAVSYVRRVAQARGDLARAELARRDAPPATPERSDDDAGLRDVLADRLLADSSRPPRPVEDHSDDPLAVELDTLCAERGFGRLDELDRSEIEQLVAALDEFEQDISTRRQTIFTELDALTDALVERLHDEHATPDASPPADGR